MQGDSRTGGGKPGHVENPPDISDSCANVETAGHCTSPNPAFMHTENGPMTKRHIESSHYFYKGDNFTTVLKGGQSKSVFRAQDIPLAEQNHETSTITRAIACDSAGSVLCFESDPAQERYNYSSYGFDSYKTKPSSVLGFNGERRNDKCYYFLGNGYRIYSPTLMRFHSTDSYSPFGAGGLNAYAYCEGDPVNYRDPSGHMGLGGKNTNFLQSPPKANLQDVSHIPHVAESILKNLPGKDLAQLSKTSKSFNQIVETVSPQNAEKLYKPHDIGTASRGNWPGVLPKHVIDKRIEHLELLDEIGKISRLQTEDNGVENVGLNRLKVQRMAIRTDKFYRDNGIPERDPISGRRNAIRLG